MCTDSGFSLEELAASHSHAWCVGDRTADDLDNLVDRFWFHRSSGGQHNHALGHCVRVGQQKSGMRVIGAVGKHVMTTRPEIFPSKHLFGMQDLDNFIPRERKLI